MLPLCVGTPIASPPSPRRCSAACSQASGLRLATATRAPANTKPSASARPIPLVPPVTMTVRPVMSKRRSKASRFTGSVEQIGIDRHVVLNGFSGPAGDLLHLVGGAVVPAVPMQSRHRRDVLADMVGQANGIEHFALPPVERHILR